MARKLVPAFGKCSQVIFPGREIATETWDILRTTFSQGLAPFISLSIRKTYCITLINSINQRLLFRIYSSCTIWVCLKMVSTPKPNGFADHYPYEKWLFHWEYTLFSDKPISTLTLHQLIPTALVPIHAASHLSGAATRGGTSGILRPWPQGSTGSWEPKWAAPKKTHFGVYTIFIDFWWCIRCMDMWWYVMIVCTRHTVIRHLISFDMFPNKNFWRDL